MRLLKPNPSNESTNSPRRCWARLRARKPPAQNGPLLVWGPSLERPLCRSGTHSRRLNQLVFGPLEIQQLAKSFVADSPCRHRSIPDAQPATHATPAESQKRKIMTPAQRPANSKQATIKTQHLASSQRCARNREKKDVHTYFRPYPFLKLAGRHDKLCPVVLISSESNRINV